MSHNAEQPRGDEATHWRGEDMYEGAPADTEALVGSANAGGAASMNVTIEEGYLLSRVYGAGSCDSDNYRGMAT